MSRRMNNGFNFSWDALMSLHGIWIWVSGLWINGLYLGLDRLVFRGLEVLSD